ncbi:polyprotein P2a2b [Solanum nodiflorum mottle virus]|uniref:Polyprotein P2a2b n=1 Tax=Solanum nodiflorum mottle virus TaxID=12471 RepID=A0A1P7XK80_9VIRU|nr:polyprotein P2a2b [Solanum nodiflorum mottle virus]AHB64347.1 polyprotein P2a2b [Solanum nodiflorum mottle virus]
MLSQIVHLVLLCQMWAAVIATMILDPKFGWMITSLISLTCLELTLKPIRSLIRYVKVEVGPEPESVEFGRLVGQPTLDPVRGITSKCIYKNMEFQLVIQPNWWPLVYPAAVSQASGIKESAVIGSSFSVVRENAEPASLVTIYNGDSRVGMGSRVSYNKENYLLTAHHVWKLLDGANFRMAKTGKSVEVKGASTFIAAPHSKLDFALIKIPNKYWSSLGVGVSTLIPLKGSESIVTVYGGPSTELASSFGKVSRDSSNYLRLLHTASTAPGWSGSPLYNSKGFVVGLHTGVQEFGVENEGVDVAALLPYILKKETVYSDIGLTQIDVDEVPSRGFQFDDFEIHGEYEFKGKMAKGEIALYKPYTPLKGGKAWADYSDDDSLPDLDLPHKESLPDMSLNLPEGSSDRFRAALKQLEEIEWTRESTIGESGMLFNSVGISTCKFREGSKHASRGDVAAAQRVFSELNEYGWPERGSRAEKHSLFLQASRHRRVPKPKGLEEACRELEKLYPRSRAKQCFRKQTFLDDELLLKAIKETAFSPEINDKASPGSPWSKLAERNGLLLNSFGDFVVEAVRQRILKLAAWDPTDLLMLKPSAMVRMGLVDPARVFVKQEPHTNKKLSEGRYRLISSVSIVDQIIERLLFGPQNQLEIATWSTIPSKPGMGLSLRSQAELLWNDLKHKHRLSPASEADISGFDWSVQEWELWSDLSMRVNLCDDMHEGLKRLMINRFRCFMFSVFQLSNGELLEQTSPGIMKSGSYCTSSTNSRIRCLMGVLIGSPWIVAMGDDSVEGWVTGAKEKYLELGHVCKEYRPCETTRDGELSKVNFCSHELSEGRFWLTSWAKTLYKFLDSPNESHVELERELSSGPMWPRVKRYLCQVGLIPDKTLEERKDGEEATKVETTHRDGAGNRKESPSSEEPASASQEGRSDHYGDCPDRWYHGLPTEPYLNEWASGDHSVPLGGCAGCTEYGHCLFCYVGHPRP